MHSHECTCIHLHTPRWNPLFCERAKRFISGRKARSDFLELWSSKGGIERKYDKLCLWNVSATICKHFELSPHLLAAELCFVIARAFLCIWKLESRFSLNPQVCIVSQIISQLSVLQKHLHKAFYMGLPLIKHAVSKRAFLICCWLCLFFIGVG